MSARAASTHRRGGGAARRLAARARAFLAALGREEAELSILVVGDVAMRRLNRTWRGLDAATDVLSFPQPGPHAAGVLLGDVVISLDTAERVAASSGRRTSEELDRYLAHGLLHLLGHDHHAPAEARRMAAAEDALVGAGLVGASGGGTSRAVSTPRRARAAVERAAKAPVPRAERVTTQGRGREGGEAAAGVKARAGRAAPARARAPRRDASRGARRGSSPGRGR